MNKRQENEILKIAIDEQRRVYDDLADSFSRGATRALTFIGAGFAILAYLYSNKDLFLPKELYGVIFYFVGLLLLIGSIGILLFSIKPTPWEAPTEQEDLKNIRANDEIEYLRYIKNRYLECWMNNIRTHENRNRMVNLGFVFMLIGAIILIVIKTF